MIELKPIYPEEIEKIKAEYAAQIAEAEGAMKQCLQVNCDMAVAEAIGRQRQEAIAAGGELGKRIAAENAAAAGEAEKALRESFTPEQLAAAKAAVAQRQAEFAAMPDVSNNSPTATPEMIKCPYCGSLIKRSKFCPDCGAGQEQ